MFYMLRYFTFLFRYTLYCCLENPKHWNCADVLSSYLCPWFWLNSVDFLTNFHICRFYKPPMKPTMMQWPLLCGFFKPQRGNPCQIKMKSSCLHENCKNCIEHTEPTKLRGGFKIVPAPVKNNNDGDVNLLHSEGLEVHSQGHTCTVITGTRWKPGLFSHVLNWSGSQFFLMFVMDIHHLFSM